MAKFDEAQEGERERWRSDPMTQRYLEQLAREVEQGNAAIAEKFTRPGGQPPDLHALKFLGGQVAGFEAAISLAGRK